MELAIIGSDIQVHLVSKNYDVINCIFVRKLLDRQLPSACCRAGSMANLNLLIGEEFHCFLGYHFGQELL